MQETYVKTRKTLRISSLNLNKTNLCIIPKSPLSSLPTFLIRLFQIWLQNTKVNPTRLITKTIEKLKKEIF